MKIELEANTIPDDAKPIAQIAIALYIDPNDGHPHLAVPFEISPTAERWHVLLVHQIMQGFGKYFQKCKLMAKAEFEKEVNDGE